ncbi:TIGR04076 family protein [Thermodesulfobacteriota bacterium]
MPIRITVKGGKCQGRINDRGQVFMVEDTTPEGMCTGAWMAVAPYIMALRYGGNFPWEDKEGYALIHCPDPKGITLELRRIDRQ